ncbi:hypothetical protein KZC51_14250 [Microbacterium sp. SSW1-49]|uniref:FUSC family protein n=1 Tax=Microbacterium croceum TaxID=2851645 RepID=A0ABT0FHR7_9MICO|nr:hypothetical protein [Microbacterium croceum]MCK2037292.1 hypothetical protein [Microbacterium croceum]
MATVMPSGTGAAGLATRAARLAMIAVWCCGIAQGALEGLFSPPVPAYLLALLVVLAGAIVLTHRSDEPLRGVRAWAVPAATLAATVLMLSVLHEAGETWVIYFASYLVALQIGRGNPMIGGIGLGAQIALILGWGSLTGQTAAGMVDMLSIPIMSGVLGVIWRLTLRSIVARERAHRSEAAESARKAAAARAAAAQYRRELGAIAAEVQQVLERVRDADELDEDFLTELTMREGTIRDRIRSPRLHHPALADAAADARLRGVRVAVLGSHVPDAPRISDRTAAQVAAVLDGIADGSVVISSGARSIDALSIVIDDGEAHRRIEMSVR